MASTFIDVLRAVIVSLCLSALGHRLLADHFHTHHLLLLLRDSFSCTVHACYELLILITAVRLHSSAFFRTIRRHLTPVLEEWKEGAIKWVRARARARDEGIETDLS